MQPKITVHNKNNIPTLGQHTIYVDMDGVLADFDAAVAERYFVATGTADLYPKTKAGSWKVANDPTFFSSLKPITSGMVMLEYLLQNQNDNYVVGILSATGDHHDLVQAQKFEWLQKHIGVSAFNGPIIFVSSGVNDKKMFAESNTTLIDDTEAVCGAFEGAGGQTILFSPNRYTLMEVQELVESLK